MLTQTEADRLISMPKKLLDRVGVPALGQKSSLRAESMHCDELVASYVEWLKQRVTVTNLDEGCETTAPFLDRHNDYLQIYVRQAGDKIELSDAGYVLTDLSLAWLDLGSPRRREMLSTILRGFGVTESEGRLTIDATKRDFPAKKHALVDRFLNGLVV